MEGLIIVIPAFWYGLVAIVLLVLTFYVLVTAENKLYAVAPLLCMLMSIWFWVIASTAFVVPVNNRALVIDNNAGRIEGELLPPGIQHKGLLNTHYILYPGASEEQWCTDYTPSVIGGLEVKITVCMTYDAAHTNWKLEYTKTNKPDAASLYAYWQNELRTRIAAVINAYRGPELTSKRPDVESKLMAVLQKWFKERGITVISATMPNWNYTNPEVAGAFDKNASAQAGLEQAQADLEKAKVERDVALYRANTQVEVLKALASGQSEALNQLGITDSESRAWFLVQREILNLIAANPNANLVISVGGQSVTVPAGSNGTPSPQNP